MIAGRCGTVSGSGGEPQPVKPAAIVGEGDQVPFGCDPGDAAEVEAGEAEGGLDDAEDRFDGLLAAGVEVFGILGVQLGQYGAALGFGGEARCPGLGWGAEIVGSVRLGAADGGQWLDAACLERGDGLA